MEINKQNSIQYNAVLFGNFNDIDWFFNHYMADFLSLIFEGIRPIPAVIQLFTNDNNASCDGEMLYRQISAGRSIDHTNGIPPLVKANPAKNNHLIELGKLANVYLQKYSAFSKVKWLEKSWSVPQGNTHNLQIGKHLFKTNAMTDSIKEELKKVFYSQFTRNVMHKNNFVQFLFSFTGAATLPLNIFNSLAKQLSGSSLTLKIEFKCSDIDKPSGELEIKNGQCLLKYVSHVRSKDGITKQENMEYPFNDPLYF